jgi:hypothetical protein
VFTFRSYGKAVRGRRLGNIMIYCLFLGGKVWEFNNPVRGDWIMQRFALTRCLSLFLLFYFVLFFILIFFS